MKHQVKKWYSMTNSQGEMKTKRAYRVKCVCVVFLNAHARVSENKHFSVYFSVTMPLVFFLCMNSPSIIIKCPLQSSRE